MNRSESDALSRKGRHDGLLFGRTLLSCFNAGMSLPEMVKHLNAAHADINATIDADQEQPVRSQNHPRYTKGVVVGLNGFLNFLAHGQAQLSISLEQFQQLGAEVKAIGACIDSGGQFFIGNNWNFPAAARDVCRGRTDGGSPACYKCRKALRGKANQTDALKISFRGGWGSSFGDGVTVTCLLCDECYREMIYRNVNRSSAELGIEKRYTRSSD